MARLLEHLGHRCDSVANGREALEALSGREYDAVLMDIQMPEMDGLSASRLIRSAPPGIRRPRIIAITADDSHEQRAACESAGIDAILTKPFRLQGLVAALGGHAPAAGPRDAGGSAASSRSCAG